MRPPRPPRRAPRHARPPRRRGAAVGALALVALGLGTGAAPVRVAQTAKTYGVKARFLARFIEHTTWPATAFDGNREPFVLGIAGHDPFDGQLDRAVQGLNYGSHPVVVHRLARLEDAARVHVLFLGRQGPGERETVLEACRHLPVLVVGDERGLVERGAALAFYMEHGKVRFEASTAAIRRARLRVSSELLKVADVVEKRGGA